MIADDPNPPLACGHGVFDSHFDCITCLQYAVKVLNNKVSRLAAQLSLHEKPVKADKKCDSCSNEAGYSITGVLGGKASTRLYCEDCFPS